MEKYTINIHNLYGVITKTFHPKTTHDMFQISPDESMELMGCLVDFTISIGDFLIGGEPFIIEDGDMAIFDVQPFYKRGQGYDNKHRLTRIYNKGLFCCAVTYHITKVQ